MLIILQMKTVSYISNILRSNDQILVYLEHRGELQRSTIFESSAVYISHARIIVFPSDY